MNSHQRRKARRAKEKNQIYGILNFPWVKPFSNESLKRTIEALLGANPIRPIMLGPEESYKPIGLCETTEQAEQGMRVYKTSFAKDLFCETFNHYAWYGGNYHEIMTPAFQEIAAVLARQVVRGG